MGREIKFRAWDSEYKYMMQPDEESQVESENVNTIFWLLATKERHEEVTFMQFIGQQDLNNKDIYEKDLFEIVGWSGFKEIYIVEFSEGEYRLAQPPYKDYQFYNGDYPHGDRAEGYWSQGVVIGNLYEHKYLLNPGK